MFSQAVIYWERYGVMELAFQRWCAQLVAWCVRLAQSASGGTHGMLRKLAVTGAGALSAASVGAAYV